MRDFRDAKAMAQTLRTALAGMGHKITISQSLELMARIFGLADWNSLAAAIRTATFPSRKTASSPAPQNAATIVLVPEFEATVRRALHYAHQRKHEYATLEHLLLALLDDPDASAALKACNAELDALRQTLTNFIDNELSRLMRADGAEPRPSAAFERVIGRAAIDLRRAGLRELTGAQLLIGIFPERESLAAKALLAQGANRDDMENFVLHGGN